MNLSSLLAPIRKIEDRSYLKPIFKLEVDGVEISGKIHNRLIRLSLTETRGLEADQLDIELDDTDGKLTIPEKGVLMSVYLGFESENHILNIQKQKPIQTGLVYKGEFKIDEVSHQGTPDTLSIKGISMDLTDQWAEAKEKSWHKKTIEEIVATIAKDHQCDYIISESLKSEKVDHIDQTNESDAAFLTRLAEQYDAGAVLKNGLLLFFNLNEPITPNGEPIPVFEITRNKGDNHSYTTADTQDYKAVKAFYTDKKTGKRQHIIINADNLEPKKDTKGKKQKSQNPKLETGEKVKVLRHLYASKQTAENGARAAFKKLKRGVAQFELALAVGVPELFPQTPVVVSGFKDQIDQESWLIKKISHNLDNNGLTSRMALEGQILNDEPEESYN